MQRDASSHVLRFQRIPGKHEARDAGWELLVVELAGVEHEQARLRLFDDVDFDAGDERQALAREAFCDRYVARLAPGARRRIEFLSVARVRSEDDLLAAHPLRKPIGASAHRMFHHAARFVLVRLDDLARHRGEGDVGQPMLEQVVRIPEFDAQRIAIDYLKALDRLVVVECACAPSRGEHFIEAGKLMLEDVERNRAHLRVENPLDAVNVILGRQLARLALERRVVREKNPGRHLDRERAPAVGDFRQSRRRIRNEARRTCEIVIGVKRIEDRIADHERVVVVDGLRIESGFGRFERHAQRPGRLGRPCRRRRQEGERDDERHCIQGSVAHALSGSVFNAPGRRSMAGFARVD